MKLQEQIKNRLKSNRVNILSHIRKKACVALILREGELGLELLFITRAIDEKDRWSGQLAFPGGKQDKEDIDDQATAERECLEEIGVDLTSSAQFLGRLNAVQGRSAGVLRDFAIHPFVYFLTEEVKFKLQLSEVSDVQWVATDFIFNKKNHSYFDYKSENHTINLPKVDLPTKPFLWGLTLIMTLDFYDRIS